MECTINFYNGTERIKTFELAFVPSPGEFVKINNNRYKVTNVIHEISDKVHILDVILEKI